MQDGDEGNARGEEGQEPDAEELVDRDVEDEVFRVIGYSDLINRLAGAFWLQRSPFASYGGLIL